MSPRSQKRSSGWLCGRKLRKKLKSREKGKKTVDYNAENYFFFFLVFLLKRCVPRNKTPGHNGAEIPYDRFRNDLFMIFEINGRETSSSFLFLLAFPSDALSQNGISRSARLRPLRFLMSNIIMSNDCAGQYEGFRPLCSSYLVFRFDCWAQMAVFITYLLRIRC